MPAHYAYLITLPLALLSFTVHPMAVHRHGLTTLPRHSHVWPRSDHSKAPNCIWPDAAVTQRGGSGAHFEHSHWEQQTQFQLQSQKHCSGILNTSSHGHLHILVNSRPLLTALCCLRQSLLMLTCCQPHRQALPERLTQTRLLSEDNPASTESQAAQDSRQVFLSSVNWTG